MDGDGGRAKPALLLYLGAGVVPVKPFHLVGSVVAAARYFLAGRRSRPNVVSSHGNLLGRRCAGETVLFGRRRCSTR